MKRLYVNAILQTYGILDELNEQIEELIYKKAYASFSDYSPGFDQCVKVVELQFEKEKMSELKRKVEVVLKRLSEEENECLNCKYFRKNPKGNYDKTEFKNRNYYRKLYVLSLKIGKCFESMGFTDKVFEEEYMSMEFFKELVKRINAQMVKRAKNGDINAVKSQKKKKEKMINKSVEENNHIIIPA